MNPTLWKIKNPFHDELKCRFVILEDRGKEALIQEVIIYKDAIFRPVSIKPKADLIRDDS